MGWSIHHPVGLIHHSPAFSHKGYTLLFNNTGNFAALVDMEGRVCHRWEHHGGLAYVKLLPNGHLLGRTRAPADFEKTQGLGGGGSSIVELDWDGVKVWEREKTPGCTTTSTARSPARRCTCAGRRCRPTCPPACAAANVPRKIPC